MQILLATADVELSRIVQESLSPEGHHVAWVRDSQTALAFCRDRTPDV